MRVTRLLMVLMMVSGLVAVPAAAAQAETPSSATEALSLDMLEQQGILGIEPAEIESILRAVTTGADSSEARYVCLHDPVTPYSVCVWTFLAEPWLVGIGVYDRNGNPVFEAGICWDQKPPPWPSGPVYACWSAPR